MFFDFLLGERVNIKNTKEYGIIESVVEPESKISVYYENRNDNQHIEYNLKTDLKVFEFDPIKNVKIHNKISFFQYFLNDEKSIHLSRNLNYEDLKKMSNNQKPSCFCICNDQECPNNYWWKYECPKANKFYEANYHDDFHKVNYRFLKKSIERVLNNNNKTNLSIVLAGSGNLYELEAINVFAKNYPHIVFNVVFLDLLLWPCNSFKHKYVTENTNFIFKKCDFYEELKNDFYKNFDIIYISRALHYNIDPNPFEKLSEIIDSHNLVIISQVLDFNKNKSIDFENTLRQYLNKNYKLFEKKLVFITNCRYMYELKSSNSILLSFVRGNPLSYFLYIIDKKVVQE